MVGVDFRGLDKTPGDNGFRRPENDADLLPENFLPRGAFRVPAQRKGRTVE